MTQKILIVDDDTATVEILTLYLSKEGFSVDSVQNGKEALQKISEAEYDLILLDIMMPKLDGLKTIKIIRENHLTPIIFISAKDTTSDRIQGFLLGCDDYIVKPFDLMELKLRIEAILKRSAVHETLNESVIRIGDLMIDPLEHTVHVKGDVIAFTAKEFEILYLLASNSGRVFSVSEIYERIWQEQFMDNDRSVLTHIGNIREKLNDSIKMSKYIKTIWGVGYKIEKEK